MDEVAILTETLNSTLQRHGRAVQNYEIEVANLTVELIKTRARVEELEALQDRNEAQPVKSVPSKT